MNSESYLAVMSGCTEREEEGEERDCISILIFPCICIIITSKVYRALWSQSKLKYIICCDF